MSERIEREVFIRATAPAVWRVLTDVALMNQWMGEREMAIAVTTDWVVGGEIVITAFHHVPVEARGTVLRFEADRAVAYTQWTSLSGLPRTPENESTIELELRPDEGGTSLRLTITGFPTEAIFKHLDFYWRVTLEVVKRFVESR